MQRAAKTHRRDPRHILPVFIHDEELQTRIGESLRRQEPMAIAGEGDLSSGQGTRAEIQDAVTEPVVGGRWVYWIGGMPVARRSIGRPLLMGEPLDLPRREMDAVNVAAGVRQIATLVIHRQSPHIRQQRVITPLRIEGEKGIRDRAIAARDEHFLRAIGMQQHEIRTGIDARRMEHLRPDRARRVTEARLPHIDDVIRNNLRTERSEPG